MSLSLEFRGWEEFRRFSKNFPSRVRMAMNDVSEEASRLIAAKARSKAPKRTGKLRDSIRASGFTIEARAPYSKFVEFGTKRMDAKPFLRPAIRESMDEVRNIFGTKIQDVLRR